MADRIRKLNLTDLALGLLFLVLLAALLVQIFVSNPLRQAVLDEAERLPVRIVVESEAAFLAPRMKAGDRHGEDAELLSHQKVGDKLRCVWRVNARRWRGFLQFGPFLLKPGERIELITDGYKLVGWIVAVHDKSDS